MSQEQWDGATERRGEGRGMNLLEVVSDIRTLTQEVRHLATELQKSREAAELQRVEDRSANKEEHEYLRVEVRKVKDAVYDPKEGLFAENGRQQAEIAALREKLEVVTEDSNARSRRLSMIYLTILAALATPAGMWIFNRITTGG